jgi:hypothetical protein
MKKSALLVLAVMVLVPSFAGAEGLLPLKTVLSVAPENSGASLISTETHQYANSCVNATANVNNGIYEATYNPNGVSIETDPNMIPQNAAAKGEPVTVQKEPRVRIRTKQRSQGNSYWNAGGKGWKSYY